MRGHIALDQAGVCNPLRVVTDGQQALEYLSGAGQFADREKFPYPALLLLDLKLPYRSGLDILTWLREQANLPQPFVVVLTGSNEPSDSKNACDLGANTYLVKPPAAEMIHDIIKAFKLDWIQCHAQVTARHPSPG